MWNLALYALLGLTTFFGLATCAAIGEVIGKVLGI